MTDILDCLGDSIDCALGVRDDLGLQLHFVKILKRTNPVVDPELAGFDGGAVITDVIEKQITPSPRIVDYSHDLRAREGGNIRQGDLLIKQISKNQYSKADINCSRLDGEGANIERYYYVNDELYTVISITEKYMWWNVQIRKHISDKVYL